MPNVRFVLAEQVLTVVNTDARLVSLKGIDEPYRERLGHASGDLSTVQPGNFGSLCGWLRSTRQGTAVSRSLNEAEDGEWPVH